VLPVSEYLTRQDGQPYPHGVAQAVLLSLQAVQDRDRTGTCAGVMELVCVLSAAGVRRDLLRAAYQEAGQVGEAIALHERTLADMERLLGPNHPDTLTSRNNLANAYWAAARVGEAVPLHERTLADMERLLGPDHPSTLGSRNNLANAYQEAGRAAEAIALHERTLADRERVLGPDHPHTLGSRNNLANAYQEAGGSSRRRWWGLRRRSSS
jgi:tetratricopeptide (TPR) repeat protein